MALPFEPEAPSCALPSCQSPNPKVWDDYKERYFCDRQCFEEFLAENLEEFVDYYAQYNLYEID